MTTPKLALQGLTVEQPYVYADSTDFQALYHKVDTALTEKYDMSKFEFDRIKVPDWVWCDQHSRLEQGQYGKLIYRRVS